MYNLLRINLLSSLLLVAACSAPQLDCSSIESKNACIDEINAALTNQDCARAIELSSMLYSSSDLTDNLVRQLYASAHACNSNLDFFGLLSDLTSSSALSSTEFWSLITGAFKPENNLADAIMDERIESGWHSTQALLATMDPGVVVTSDYQFNWNSANPGSLYGDHRTADANFYLGMVSLAIMGNVQNRYGDPASDNAQVSAFPFSLSTDLDDSTEEDDVHGCQYAASVINFVEAFDDVKDNIENATTKSAIESMLSVLKNGVGGVGGLNEACDLGCQGRDATDTGNSGDLADCGLAAGSCNPCEDGDDDCIQCPIALRARTGCFDGQQERCAAAGIVRFMEAAWQ